MTVLFDLDSDAADAVTEALIEHAGEGIDDIRQEQEAPAP